MVTVCYSFRSLCLTYSAQICARFEPKFVAQFLLKVNSNLYRMLFFLLLSVHSRLFMVIVFSSWVGANEAVRLPWSKKTRAQIASRLLRFNHHVHTFTCFKGCEFCRFNFPHACKATPSFDIVRCEASRQIEDQDVCIEDVETFVIEPRRGVCAPVINKFNVAAIAGVPANNDIKVCMSSIGLCLYLLGYTSKSENDTNVKVGMKIDCVSICLTV